MENVYQGSSFVAEKIIKKILLQFSKGFKEDTEIYLIY